MNILFLCVANSARSQMAEGLARNIFPNDWKIQSAGSRPSFVHPTAIQVMKELGIDISNQSSKSVEEIDPLSVEIVITLCQEEVCPVFLGKAKKYHWPFSDPATPSEKADGSVQNFRKVRDEIRKKLLGFKADLE